MDHQKVYDQLAKISIKLMLKEPFFGHFFSSIVKEISEKISSINISLNRKQTIKIVVNPYYWQNVLSVLAINGEIDELETQKLRYGAIKHQILHIILKHPMRYLEFGNKKLFHIAADLTVNQYIESDELTEDAITLKPFPEFGMKKGQGLDYYYKQLSDQLDGMAKSDNAQESEEQNQSQQELKNLMDQPNEQLDQHDNWDDFSDITKAEQKIIEDAINESLIQTVNRVKKDTFGSLPGFLKSYLNVVIDTKEPHINWKRILRIFTASSTRTQLKNTIRRPSKRYGTSPGIKIHSKQKILVAIDTSGSVKEDELHAFFAELYHIWKQGAEIRIVECDVKIQANYLYKGIPPNQISGRGGTNFDAPLQYANDTYLPDAIVYFTDGHAEKPTVTTRRPILWMISKEGVSTEAWDHLPGKKVKMN